MSRSMRSLAFQLVLAATASAYGCPQLREDDFDFTVVCDLPFLTSWLTVGIRSSKLLASFRNNRPKLVGILPPGSDDIQV